MTTMYAIASCCACQAIVQFNPNYVPSIRVPPSNEKQPLCNTCFDRWNVIHRTSKGLKPVELHPQAYSPEVIDEIGEYDGS